MHQQYFDIFGVSNEFNKFFEDKKELLELECEMSITGDRFLGTKINLLKIEILKNDKENIKSDFFQVKANVEKFLRIYLPVKKISVQEFYNYLKLMKKENGKN